MMEDDFDSNEIDLALSEGAFLSEDLAIAESIDGHDNIAKTLVVEGIAARWGIRKLKTESSTLRELWGVFLDWVKYITRLCLDMVNSAMGYGRRAMRRQLLLDNTFTKFRSSVTHPYQGKVKATEYARRFLVADNFDTKSCEAIMGKLTVDVPDVLKWAADSVKSSAQVLEIVRSQRGQFDTIRNVDVNGLGKNKASFFKYGIGVKLERKLRQVSNNRDSGEEQLLWALPSNAYIQLYTYYFDGKESSSSYPMEGVRYLAPEYSQVKADVLNNASEEAIPINRLYEMIRSIRPLAITLVEIETSNRKIYREIDKLTRNVELLRNTKGSITLLDKYAYRLAREQLLSANNSLRAVLHTLRTTIAGTIQRIEVHQKAHLGKI